MSRLDIHGGALHHTIKKFLVDYATCDKELTTLINLSTVHNPKLEYLVQQLQNWINRREKFLIFFDYTNGFLEPRQGYSFGEKLQHLLGPNGKKLELYRLSNKPSTWRYKLFEKFREDPETLGLALPKQDAHSRSTSK